MYNNNGFNNYENELQIKASALFQRRRNRWTKEWIYQIFKYILYFILGFLFGLWTYLKLSPHYRYYIDENYGRIDPNITNPDISEIETLCSKDTSCCYSVVDIIDLKKSIVRRKLYKNGFENEYYTVVQLIPPPGLTYEASDTRLWAINHTVIPTQSTAAIITQLFATSSFDMESGGALTLNNVDDNNEKEILIIGIRALNLAMFLHAIRPNIKITIIEEESVIVQLVIRWFRIVEDERRKIVIKDTITAFTEATENGSKYDAVILHCCDSATKAMPCSSKICLTNAVIIKFKSILKPTGTVILNFFNSVNQTTNVENIIKTLLIHFDVCIKMKLLNEENVVVSCLPYPLPVHTDLKQQILQRAKRISKELGIYEILKHIDIEILQK